MTARTISYIKGFLFQTQDVYTLSDPDEITAQGAIVRLKKSRRGALLPGRPIDFYSTIAIAFVRTKVFQPGVLATFDFVEVIGSTPKDENGTQVTSHEFRAHDGTDSRYWGGASWDIAGASDWNSLTDFNANLPAYTPTQIAVEVRLVTTDDRFTPTMEQLCLRWTGSVVDNFREWVFKTVVRSLKNNIRPLTDFTIAAPGGTSVDISAYFDAGYDVTDIIGAFDYTTDPDLATNLFSSYDSNTKIVTLTSAITADNNIWMIAVYKPDVAVTTSTDYVFNAKVPALWITAISPRGARKQLGVKGPSAIDRSLSPPQGTAYPLPIPFVDLDFTIATIAPVALDLTRLTQAFAGWMQAHPKLTSPSLDEEVALSQGGTLEWTTDNADTDDARLSTNSFSLLNVPLFHDSLASSAANDGVNTGPVDGVKAVERVVFNWFPAHGGDETTTT